MALEGHYLAKTALYKPPCGVAAYSVRYQYLANAASTLCQELIQQVGVLE